MRAKTSLISRAANLANNISTPINRDLLVIQDKRFKHLAHSFIDPRSPSEGIVRTPIVMKSSDISSIVNTPRILEEELQEDDDAEDFQKTFEERLSRLSFDCLDVDGEEEEEKVKLPDLIETHFDCLMSHEEGEAKEADSMQPLRPLVTNLIAQSALDPRSPTVGIDRTPLVFGGNNNNYQRAAIQPSNTFAEQLKAGDEQEVEEEVEKEGENNKEPTKETTIKEGEEKSIEQKEQQQATTTTTTTITESEPSQSADEVFIEVGRVIYGTPVAITATNGPIQQVRTPLSCVANRKRVELTTGKSNKSSPMMSKKQKQLLVKEANSNTGSELRVKKSNNPFETNTTTPRKLIR